MADPSQKRLLALDGGGIMGLISLGVLKVMEDQLRAAHGGDPAFRLRDFYDYIGGTSTGAIIAAGLAIGKSVDELVDFYMTSGEDMFDQAAFWRRWRYKFDSDKIRDKLRNEFGEHSILDLQRAGTLSTDRHLLVVIRNINTDSPWPVSTNPTARFNAEDDPECNRLIPLWQLVRASTAAPTFFAPEEITLPNGARFAFEDGGVTPYNNPAFLLFRMATEPAFACGWPTGEDKLMLASVGTGLSFRTMEKPNPRGEGLLTTASTIPSELMRGIAVENDINCRTFGRCVHGPHIDGELGDLIELPDPGRAKAFTYARYDIDISEAGLAAAGLGEVDTSTLQMDNAAAIDDFRRIGEAAGRQVDMQKHFPAFLP